MIYGRVVLKTNNRKFFKNGKIKKGKKGPVLTEQRSNATHIPYPIIKDHLSDHILSTEKAISDLYKSNKPTSLKIQSLSKNLDKITTLNHARKTNTGIFRITKTNPDPAPPTDPPQTPNPPQPATPRKRILPGNITPPRRPNQPAAANEDEENYYIRRLFDEEVDEPAPAVRMKRKRKHEDNYYLRSKRKPRTGYGIYEWMSIFKPKKLMWK